MDADKLPPLAPRYRDASPDPEALAKLDAPLCEACGALDRMRPAGTPERARWECPTCGAVRLA